MPITSVELYPCSEPNLFRHTTAFQCARQEYSIFLKDRDGKNLDLTSADLHKAGDVAAQDPSKPEFEDGQTSGNINSLVVRMVYKIDLGELPCIVEGIIEDASCGEVKFILEPTDLAVAGIYYAQIEIGNKVGSAKSPDDIYLFSTYPLYLNVEASLSQQMDNRTISIPEVRMHMMDNDPAQNLMLEDYEFSDTEIMYAIRNAIDAWNDELPPVAYATTANFPYRSKWLDGTVATLMKMIANRKRRNTLQYSAGGVNTDDQNYTLYERVGQQMMEEYLAWVRDRKTSINMQLGFSSIGGIGH